MPSLESAAWATATGTGATEARQHHRLEGVQQEGKKLEDLQHHGIARTPRQGTNQPVEQPHTGQQMKDSRPRDPALCTVSTSAATAGSYGYGPS